MTPLCKNFMHNNCSRTDCKFEHAENVCFYFWKYGNCKNGEKCQKSHSFILHEQPIQQQKQERNPQQQRLEQREQRPEQQQ